MIKTAKLTFGTRCAIAVDTLPLTTWTIVNSNTLSVNGNTVTQLGVGGWHESMYVAFTVQKSGDYTISYDYMITTAKVGNHGTHGFGLWLTTNNPNVDDTAQYNFYENSDNRNGALIGTQGETLTGKSGTIQFTATLTAGTTYYLWYPGAALDDGTVYTLSFTNIAVYNNPIVYELDNTLCFLGWNGYLCYTVEVSEWDIWDRVTYSDTSWQSTLEKDYSNNGTVTISTASQFINFGNNVTSFYTSNSLSSLTVNITKHFKFNDIISLTSAQEVYTTLSSSGVKANTNANGFMLIDTANLNITINGNGHILSGLYCTSNGGNSGSFIRGGSNNCVLTFNDFTFDRCLFRSNGQATSGFSMINGGTSLTTYFVNFNKCAIVSESTSNYQAIMFGFLNSNSSTTYNHTQTSFFKCGFKGSRSWSDYSCGDGGISNWTSSPRFNSKWTDSTYIEPVKLGGNGTMYLLAGNRANLTQTGTNTYYNLGTGITAQGTSVNSVETAISTFNNTTLALSRPNFALVLSNDNLYHRIEA